MDPAKQMCESIENENLIRISVSRRNAMWHVLNDNYVLEFPRLLPINCQCISHYIFEDKLLPLNI